MVYCCVPLCRSKKGQTPNVSYHTFPSDLQLRQSWIAVISREHLKINDASGSTVVCSIHFRSDDFVPERSRRILKSGAVPSIFPGYPSYKVQQIQKTRRVLKNRNYVPPYKRQRTETSDMPRMRRHLKKTAVPSLNLPFSSTESKEKREKKEKLMREKQRIYENMNKKRFPLVQEQKEVKEISLEPIRKENFKPSKSSMPCSKAVGENHIPKTPVSCVRLSSNAVPHFLEIFSNYLKNNKNKGKPLLPQDIRPFISHSNSTSTVASALAIPNISVGHMQSCEETVECAPRTEICSLHQLDHRFPQRKVKVWFSDKQNRLCSNYLEQTLGDKVSATDMEKVLKTSAATVTDLCNEVPERIFTPPGCATILALQSPLAPDTDAVQAAKELSSESSVAFSVEVNAPEELGFPNISDGIVDFVKGNSRKAILKQLCALQCKIDDLKLYTKQLKLEHVKLVEEQRNSLVKSVHNIKQNAVEGDLSSLVLLNRIVSYNRPQSN